MEKNCEDCVHALRTVDELPCCDCHGYKFFEDARILAKTLLDEFAMSAMIGGMACPSSPRVDGKIKSDASGYAEFAYSFAAAMMKERARRDEMGNVKEVK